MSQQIGGVVRAILTDTIVFDDAVNKPVCGVEIGEIRTTDVKPLTHMLNTTPRKAEYTLTKTIMKQLRYDDDPDSQVEKFQLKFKRGCFMTGMGGQVSLTPLTNLKHNYNPTNTEYAPQHLNQPLL